jgi:hypothetical protein
MTGLELAREFFEEAVAPVVARVAPALGYSAGRIGARSDALGFDDEISRDHGWGPGCTLLLDPIAFEDVASKLDEALKTDLPVRFRGYSTSYRDWKMVSIDRPPVAHAVEISTPERYLRERLGVASASNLGLLDWLTLSEQNLLETTSGQLFRDDLLFARTRERLSFYPDDVRLYLICVEWTRIAEEQAFPARAGARGDEAGSAIVLARLAESAMRICFYVERRYPPYSKWFGSAFQRLERASDLYGPIRQMLTTSEWEQRDRQWQDVLRRLIALHEQAEILPKNKYYPAPIYVGRPGTGLPQFDRGGPPAISELIDDIRSRIADAAVLALPRRLGSINQLVGCRDLEEGWPQWRAWFRALYVKAMQSDGTSPRN